MRDPVLESLDIHLRNAADIGPLPDDMDLAELEEEYYPIDTSFTTAETEELEALLRRELL